MVEGILETVDQLIIVKCMMEEVKQYQKNYDITFMIAKRPMINCTTIACCVSMNGKAS